MKLLYSSKIKYRVRSLDCMGLITDYAYKVVTQRYAPFLLFWNSKPKNFSDFNLCRFYCTIEDLIVSD